ncbi:hypothetical protein CL619_00160 [archaeon]|nr:hypothetical protein [archaeon]|tara:strand:+ start:1219 stop:2436 length:1218 start_codon:yes stop_codon:yes gene_type:complete
MAHVIETKKIRGKKLEKYYLDQRFIEGFTAGTGRVRCIFTIWSDVVEEWIQYNNKLPPNYSFEEALNYIVRFHVRELFKQFKPVISRIKSHSVVDIPYFDKLEVIEFELFGKRPSKAHIELPKSINYTVVIGFKLEHIENLPQEIRNSLSHELYHYCSMHHEGTIEFHNRVIAWSKAIRKKSKGNISLIQKNIQTIESEDEQGNLIDKQKIEETFELMQGILLSNHIDHITISMLALGMGDLHFSKENLYTTWGSLGSFEKELIKLQKIKLNLEFRRVLQFVFCIRYALDFAYGIKHFPPAKFPQKGFLSKVHKFRLKQHQNSAQKAIAEYLAITEKFTDKRISKYCMQFHKHTQEIASLHAKAIIENKPILHSKESFKIARQAWTQLHKNFETIVTELKRKQKN